MLKSPGRGQGGAVAKRRSVPFPCDDPIEGVWCEYGRPAAQDPADLHLYDRGFFPSHHKNELTVRAQSERSAFMAV